MVVSHAFNPALQRQRQMGLCDFEGREALSRKNQPPPKIPLGHEAYIYKMFPLSENNHHEILEFEKFQVLAKSIN